MPETNKVLINHGLGLMTWEEHNHLVKINAINCWGGNGSDGIKPNYPNVVVKNHKGEDEIIDVGGNIFNCNQEVLSLKSRGKNARVEWYPRAYRGYIEKKFGAPHQENEIEELAQSFGGEVVN